jgi:solute carrier family 5 (high affinity choline transporter), member 7
VTRGRRPGPVDEVHLSGTFWPGVVTVAVLYLGVFLVGIRASRKRPAGGGELQELMLAGRALPLWIGLLTMTATWVGGGYINGTAEATFSGGVLRGAQAGIGYSLSLVLGGLFFARVMRRHRFSTLIDPLESRFGKVPAAILMIPAVLAEVFWSAAVLVALGTTFGTVLGFDLTTSILVSGSVAVAYTMVGGLRAVAYTDVVQLALLVVGLGIAVPFITSAAGGVPVLVGQAVEQLSKGLGSQREAVTYGDWMVLLILGGIPWNIYFQRVLATRDETEAAKLSVRAGVLCAVMAVPPLFIGLAATRMDWSTAAGAAEVAALGGAEAVAASLKASPSLVLPYMLRLAVPDWVCIVGLGAVAAAVMASVDSSILSGASLVSWNGYKRLVKPHASAREVTTLMRALVVVLGIAAMVIALTVQSVAALWYLCGDVVYCVLFPQLALALFDKRANATGALAGFAVSVFLRLGGGEPSLGLAAFLPYPEWDPAGDIAFPFRTLSMLTGLVVAVVVSRATAPVDLPRPLVALPDFDLDTEESPGVAG